MYMYLVRIRKEASERFFFHFNEGFKKYMECLGMSVIHFLETLNFVKKIGIF